MNAVPASAPQFPTPESLPAFLAACTANPSPWAALQDALWECGITTRSTIEASDEEQNQRVRAAAAGTRYTSLSAVHAEGDTLDARLAWRRQHTRTTYRLTIDDNLGRSRKEWQTLLQWAAIRQFQYLTAATFLNGLSIRETGSVAASAPAGVVAYSPPLPDDSAEAEMAKTLAPIILALLSAEPRVLLGSKISEQAIGVCFGDEYSRYVVSVAGYDKPIDYSLRDTFDPLLKRAWSAQRESEEVRIYGEGVERADMVLVLSSHLLRYRWLTPPIPVVGYVYWDEGEMAGLLGATVDFYRREMNTRGESALLTTGHWKQAAEWELEPLDMAAQGQTMAFAPVVSGPGNGDLRDSVWKRLNEAAKDDVDRIIIRRRWQSWPKPPFREPYASIARDLGMSSQAVSRRWLRLRESVRDLLPEPEVRPRLPYSAGERELLWEMEGLTDLTGPVRRVPREEDPAAYIAPSWWWESLPTYEALDSVLRQSAFGYTPEDKTVTLLDEKGTQVSVGRYGDRTGYGREWGSKGIALRLLSGSVRHAEAHAQDGQDGWTDEAAGTLTATRDNSYGYAPAVAHRPGRAGQHQRNRLVDADRAAQATSSGEKVWGNVGVTGAKMWTVTGLGRRSSDGPLGTESAGFGELHIEQGPPRTLKDGRPIPPMPEEDYL